MTYTLTSLQLEDSTYLATYEGWGDMHIGSRVMYREGVVLEVDLQIPPDQILISGTKEEILNQ